MNPKRIVIYVDTMNKSGGRERVITNLIKRWQTEYDLTLITKDSGDSFYPLPQVRTVSIGVPVSYTLNPSRIQRILDSGVSLLDSIKKLKRVLKNINYDYIYVSTPQNAYEAYRAMDNPKDRLVISEHAFAFSFNSVYMLMKKIVYPKAYCISVPNKTDTETYRRWKCNSIYVPHMLTYNAVNRNSLDTKIAINVGRLTDDKQQELLLTAWEGIDVNNWELWIVGDGENKEKLSQKIENSCLRDRVKLLPARREIEKIYKKASLFIFTSRCEGFGMVLLEAMSFGIPCISFDCPSGPRDVIDNNLNGRLVKNGDVDALKECISEYLNMDERDRDKMGKAAFETVQKWNNDAILDQWKEIFE